jgi:hypothetical protein
MSVRFIKRFILPVVTLIFLAIALQHIIVPKVLSMQMADILAEYGFKDARITKTYLYKDNVIFESIQLDPNDFSLIESIRADFKFSDLFTKNTFNQVIFDKIILSGELAENGDLKISGWNGKINNNKIFSEANKIEFQHITLDLITGIGALRFETKAKTIKTPSGDYDIQLTFWADQYQLQFETNWKGEYLKDGSYNLDGEIINGKINLDYFAFNRIHGWSNLTNKNISNSATIGGQLSIGAFNFKDLPFSKSDLTFDLSREDQMFFMNAEAAGFKNLELALEYKKNIEHEKPWIIGSFITNELNPFLSFMTALYDTLSSDIKIPSAYKDSAIRVLGVHETRKDIRQTLKESNFEQIEFSISGPYDDLIGKVSGQSKSHQKAGRYVIRLDPDITE